MLVIFPERPSFKENGASKTRTSVGDHVEAKSFQETFVSKSGDALAVPQIAKLMAKQTTVIDVNLLSLSNPFMGEPSFEI
jgi:hypothetical protein